MKRSIRFVLALVVASLAACGGGGGGDDGGTSRPKVTLTITSPTSVDAELYERQQVPSVGISGRLSGDVAALSGKSLYVFVFITDALLFDPQPSLGIHSDGLGGTVSLIGATPPDGARVYAGTISVRACLDAACDSELDVVNGSIPYTIRVKTGLKTPSRTLALETTFGTFPAAVTMPLTLPDGARSWLIRPCFGGNFGVVEATKAADGSNAVVFGTRELTLPGGEYREHVCIHADTPDGQTLGTSVEVTATTLPSAVPFAFQRPSAQFVRKALDPNISDSVSGGALFPDNGADRFSHVSTTFTWPASASTSSMKDRWLQEYRLGEAPPRRPELQYIVDLSVVGCIAGECLPAGRYEATIRYRYVPAVGAAQEVTFPVTLDVVP